MSRDLTVKEEAFLKRLMKRFNVPQVNIEKQGTGDISVTLGSAVPTIRVGEKWSAAPYAERCKRLLHEFLHIAGMRHDAKARKAGYYSKPERDKFSEEAYHAFVGSNSQSNPLVNPEAWEMTRKEFEAQPDVVFHGGHSTYKISTDRKGTSTGSATARLGAFFTPRRSEAERYVKAFHGGKGVVQSALVNLHKPYRMSFADFDDLATIDWKAQDFPTGEKILRDKIDNFKNQLVANGYDGIIIGGRNETKPQEVVAFNESSIIQHKYAVEDALNTSKSVPEKVRKEYNLNPLATHYTTPYAARSIKEQGFDFQRFGQGLGVADVLSEPAGIFVLPTEPNKAFDKEARKEGLTVPLKVKYPSGKVWKPTQKQLEAKQDKYMSEYLRWQYGFGPKDIERMQSDGAEKLPKYKKACQEIKDALSPQSLGFRKYFAKRLRDEGYIAVENTDAVTGVTQTIVLDPSKLRVVNPTASVARKIGSQNGINWTTAPFSLSEFRAGLKEELEHKDVTGGDLLTTGKIALAHLKEDPKYYQKLAKVFEHNPQLWQGVVEGGSTPYAAFDKSVAEQYAKRVGGRVQKVQYKPKKELDLTSLGESTHYGMLLGELYQKGVLKEIEPGQEKEKALIGLRRGDDYIAVWRVLEKPEVRRLIKAAGYDSVRFEDQASYTGYDSPSVLNHQAILDLTKTKRQNPSSWSGIQVPLYHVTTNRSKLLKEGYREEETINTGAGANVGGYVWTTADKRTADRLQAAMRKLRKAWEDAGKPNYQQFFDEVVFKNKDLQAIASEFILSGDPSKWEDIGTVKIEADIPTGWIVPPEFMARQNRMSRPLLAAGIKPDLAKIREQDKEMQSEGPKFYVRADIRDEYPTYGIQGVVAIPTMYFTDKEGRAPGKAKILKNPFWSSSLRIYDNQDDALESRKPNEYVDRWELDKWAVGTAEQWRKQHNKQTRGYFDSESEALEVANQTGRKTIFMGDDAKHDWFVGTKDEIRLESEKIRALDKELAAYRRSLPKKKRWVANPFSQFQQTLKLPATMNLALPMMMNPKGKNIMPNSEFWQMSPDELSRLDTAVLDRAAFGITSGDIVSIMPERLSIQYDDDLKEANYQMKTSGLTAKQWAQQIRLTEPIQVTLRNGKYEIEDGHHRYLAAKILKKPLRAQVEIDDNPIIAIYRKAIQEGKPVPEKVRKEYNL